MYLELIDVQVGNGSIVPNAIMNRRTILCCRSSKWYNVIDWSKMEAKLTCRPSPAKSARNVFVKTRRSSKTRKKPEYSICEINRISSSIKQQLTYSSDEYCPHCDNHYVLEAKTPAPTLNMQAEQPRSIFDVKDAAARLG